MDAHRRSMALDARAWGTTIVQVTHPASNAAYGNRVVKLRDGFMES